MWVQSFPELYTLFLGWEQYNRLWELLVKTGIAYIPFIVMLLKHFSEPVTSQETKEATLISQRRMELGLVTSILVVMFAAVPVVNVHPNQTTFTPLCSEERETARPGDSGTTYDYLFEKPKSVKVPVWWYAILRISQGITHAAKKGVSCQTDLRGLQLSLDLAKIESPQLREETQTFYQQCYLPARQKLLQEKPDISALIKRFGQSDVEWLGSHILQSLPGYYNQFQAKQIMTGFYFEAKRDWRLKDLRPRPRYGLPTCYEWWTAPKHGLHAQLKEALPPKVKWYWFSNQPNQRQQDEVIKTLIESSIPSGFNTINNNRSWMKDPISGTAGYALGTAFAEATLKPVFYLLREILPLVQAILLMAIYAFLAPALVFSNYRISTVVTLSAVIFSITFWGYLWHWVNYLDVVFMQALYTDAHRWYSMQAVLVEVVTGTLFLGLPLFWSLLLGWVGVKAGAGIQAAVSGMSQPAQEGGGKAGSIVSSAVIKRT